MNQEETIQPLRITFKFPAAFLPLTSWKGVAGTVQGGIRHPNALQPWETHGRAELGVISVQPEPFFWGICTSQKLARAKGYRIAGSGQGELSSVSHLPSKTRPCSWWYPRNPP